MKEYKVVYWDDFFPTIKRSIVTEFENELNNLSKEGWIVKTSHIELLPNMQGAVGMAAYALLEREKKS